VRLHTLVVLHNIAQMITTAVVSFAHAYGIVRKVDIAVVAENWTRQQISASVEKRIIGGKHAHISAFCYYWCLEALLRG
jgi:hypothetical protein